MQSLSSSRQLSSRPLARLLPCSGVQAVPRARSATTSFPGPRSSLCHPQQEPLSSLGRSQRHSGGLAPACRVSLGPENSGSSPSFSSGTWWPPHFNLDALMDGALPILLLLGMAVPLLLSLSSLTGFAVSSSSASAAKAVYASSRAAGLAMAYKVTPTVPPGVLFIRAIASTFGVALHSLLRGAQLLLLAVGGTLLHAF